MMMAASAEDNKGFNFGNMKYDDDDDNYVHDHDFSSDIDNSGVNSGFYDDDIGVIGNFDVDDDIAIDFDSFFTILNEPEFPINPFYPSMDNTQEDVAAAHVVNNDDFQFQQGYGAASENSAETVEALEQDPLALPQYELLTQASGASFGKSDIESGLHQSPNSIETFSSPSTQDWLSVYNISAGCPIPSRNPIDVNNGMMLTNEAAKNVIKRDLDDSQSPHSWTDNKPTIGVQVGAANVTASEVPVYNFLDGQSPDPTPHDNYTADQVDTVSTFDSSSTTTDEASAEPFGWSLMDQSCFKPAVEVKDKKNNGLALLNSSEDTSCRISEEAGLEGRFYGAGVKKFIGTHNSGGLASRSIEYHHSFGTDRKHTNVPSLKGPVSSAKFGASSFKKVEVVPQAAKMELNPVGGSHGASLSDNRNSEADDDDDDVCIIEDFRVPVGLRHSSVHGKSVTQHLSSFSPVCSPLATSFQQVGVSGTRAKATGERLIFQAVVQDLSQPKSEASPPDGVLAVPLLRHQRIALSWMVQKETTSLQCSGGILADDQGLGKTVSTIALILTERAPSARTTKKAEQGELEMLDLDEEDNKQASSGASSKGALSSSSVRGRPSGGTLVVCPTSVLRQWNDELRNKVTDKAKLSVCIYHGSSRTKDPYELANYDIVLTTYSIVSMEVPKPVSVKDGNDQGKLQTDVAAPSKKRKHSSTSDKRCSKRGVDNGLLESAARPLARVGWFRVVLDEAQSIKNYRTQVAQACWGLRAKRRWCLSGTPIQNAVDDLYSYFRFLRYEPYSVYKSFCYNVKLPITRDPTNGYKKLQAVLKTIMLRRTKGTLLDGEPIINLPPKSVKLKKVEFSEKERAFYTRLEADSRAQFQAYAALGTVKQNYVNILLMLLRLRQACDHPFLVKGHGSSSVFKSSIHAAKKLPREQQFDLLNCLEASLAICGICNDPPEDAVVSVCGHVFCSQCISERLTGDENHCPVTECKTQLNVSSVFSKGTLKSCLSVESCQEGYQMWHSYGFSDQGESAGSPPASFNSSKIRAALEVLQSLPKLHRTIPDNVAVESSVTDDGCFDKSSSSFSSHNDSSVAGNGPASASSGATEKAIVFSQWTSMLDLLEACLKESTIQYRRLDGTMSVIARDKAVKDFNTIPEVSVMIMSLKAASLGLNMVAACHVILLDLWWNPTTEDQAIDRAHRIGQTRPVTVVRLTVKDTVEDRILALQQKKRELVASCFGEDETGSRQSRLTVEDLQYLFMA